MNADKTSGVFEYTIFISIIGICVYLIFFKFIFLTIVIFFSYVIADIMQPIFTFLKEIGIQRWLASLISIILVMSILFILGSFAIPPLIGQITTVESHIHEIISIFEIHLKHMSYYFSKIFGHEKEIIALATTAVDYLKLHFTSFILNSALSILKTIPTFGIFILIPIISYFFILNMENYRSKMKNAIQLVLGDEYINVFSGIHDVILEYIRGMLILIVLVFLLTFIGFNILGIKYAFLFAALSGILYIIPYVGAAVAIIPPLLFAVLIHKSIILGIEIIVVFLPIHFILGNIVAPLIFSKTLHMDPLAILLSMLFFGELFGLWGVILSVPLLGVIVISYEKLIPILSKRRND